MGEKRWNVWRVHYAEYVEVLTMGDKQQEIVACMETVDVADHAVAKEMLKGFSNG